MKILGIGGGSGAGKSSCGYWLVDHEPSQFEIINLDDYQRRSTDPDLPRLNGMVNWDTPDAVRWNVLRRDLAALQSGQSVRFNTWAHRSNPNRHPLAERISRVIRPSGVVIVEGHLALSEPIFDVYDHTVYLDLDEATRLQRRRDARGGNDTLGGPSRYVTEVLHPMHAAHIEPTKEKADLVIDVTNKTIADVGMMVLGAIDL